MPKPTIPRAPNNYEPDAVAGQDIVDMLDDILAGISEFTRSGRPVPNPLRSVANTPEIPLVRYNSATGGVPLTGPGYQTTYDPLATTKVKELYAARQPAAIAALLDGISLDLPPHPPAAPAAPVTRPPARMPISGAAGLAGLLVDLLTYSGDTNSNEDEKLKEKRGPGYSNRPAYQEELQKALQQLQGNKLP